ncbi:hypothetical protein [uncultured Dokdonia sp.]|uniref:tetratricopeptide repeat protein n=1 Tax=uncultured Dokdonia sp. TaxID=575653 RepID=UPI0026298CC1|nr:hypothetical protein [uncultured Dokdonia sp.]
MSQLFEDKRQQEIEAYIQGIMSQEQLAIFEEKLANDKDLQEDVLLQESLRDSFREDNWATVPNDTTNETLQELKTKLRDDSYTSISKTIKEVGVDYQQKMLNEEKKQGKRLYYRMAIAAMVILLCALPFLINSQLHSDYDQYANWDSLPSLREKGDTQAKIIEGESLYLSGNYEEAIQYLKANIDTSDPYYSYALIYLGASYFQIDKLEEAHQAYDALIATNTLQSSYGYWYKLLMYLKVENTEKTNEMLTLILSNPDHYNYTKAKEIQEGL